MSQTQQQQVIAANYEFSAAPRAVNSKSKYRDPGDSRGSRNSGGNETAQGGYVSKSSMRSHGKSNTLLSKMSNRDAKGELQGYEENVLEELQERDRDPEEVHKLVPYYYVDRPATPVYKPLPKGRDVASQVEDHELFDFELEVRPILEVLVGRTLEQARVELLEEYEAEQELKHRHDFEKLRNAELMVTQRKENEWIRKEAERNRRKKQHGIKNEDNRITHQKYISRIYAKGVIHGMRTHTFQVLDDQGVLRHNLPITLRNSYMPYLLKYANRTQNVNQYLETSIATIAEELQNKLSSAHAGVVQAEFDRRQNIRDRRQREVERKEMETKQRRERRRQLRIFFAKKALSEQIEAKIVKVCKDLDDVLTVEVTDISGGTAEKETVSVVGGYFAQLCFLLQVLNPMLAKPITSLKQILAFFTKFFNDVLKQGKFDLYIPESLRANIEEIERQMADNLAEFNQNKDKIIEQLVEDTPGLNLGESLGYVDSAQLFDPNTRRLLNQALFYLHFTSVDYKPPEKPKPEQPENGNNNQDQQPQDEPANGDDGDKGDDKGDDKPAVVDNPADQPAEVKPEEEWKAPEITEEEMQHVKSREKIRIIYVPDSQEEDHPQYDAFLRMRMPLDRELNTTKSQDTARSTISKRSDKGKNAKADLKPENTSRSRRGNNIDIIDQKQPAKKDEDNKGKQPNKNPDNNQDEENKFDAELPSPQLPPEPEDFIEPYNGETFEKHRRFFPEMELAPEGPQSQAFNQRLMPEKKFAQSNHKAQAALARRFLALIKENFPTELHNFKNDEEIIAKVRELYRNAEKAVLEKIIKSFDETPIFDYEIY